MGYVRRPIAAAVAWAIIADLIGKHKDANDLRAYEWHPGGGQSDLLSIIRVCERSRTFELVADFDLLGGGLRRYVRGELEMERKFEWLDGWLINGPTVTPGLARDFLGFGEPIKRATVRRLFGLHLMSSLLTAQMGRPDFLDTRMAYVDSSGPFAGGPHKEVSLFTGLDVAPPFGSWSSWAADWPSGAAADCWLLFQGPQKDLAGALRMDGYLSSAREPHRAHDLFTAFENGWSMRRAVWEAELILSGA